MYYRTVDEVLESWEPHGVVHDNESQVDDEDSFCDNNVSVGGDIDDHASLGGGSLSSIDTSSRQSQDNAGITYQRVLAECTELVRVVSGNQGYLRSVSDFVRAAVQRAREGLSLEFYFGSSFSGTDVVNNASDSQYVLRGRVGHVPNARHKQRLKSRYEIGRGSGKSDATPRRTNINHASNDASHITRRPKTKTCRICREPGHQRKRCPRILCWESQPIEGDEQRELFLSNLKSRNYFFLEEAGENYSKEVSNEFPKSLSGIVLHRKVVVRQGESSEVAVACTILKDRCEPHEQYKEYPFSLSAVTLFIVRNKSKIVISRLKPSGSTSEDGWNDFGFCSQNAVQAAMMLRNQLSQLSQLSHSRPTENEVNEFQDNVGHEEAEWL
jgi:hypothetical protein